MDNLDRNHFSAGNEEREKLARKLDQVLSEDLTIELIRRREEAA